MAPGLVSPAATSPFLPFRLYPSPRPQCSRHRFRSGSCVVSAGVLRQRSVASYKPAKWTGSAAAFNDAGAEAGTTTQGTEEEDELRVLTSMTTEYNKIRVVDSSKSRFLLLDDTYNISSLLNKDKSLTGLVWDEFATLPSIIPNGPIAILGLGAGTAAQIMLDLWPSLHLEGWEIDRILVDKAREYFGLSDLEKPGDGGGYLSVNIGDALSPLATIEGGFAGMVVDLFADGKILPQLQEVETWLELEKRLMPNGRIMVNCAGMHLDTCNCSDGSVDLPDSYWSQHPTIRALSEAFKEKLSWKRIGEKGAYNYLALSGPNPDLDSWAAAVPSQLSLCVLRWKPCLPENLHPK